MSTRNYGQNITTHFGKLTICICKETRNFTTTYLAINKLEQIQN